MNATAYIRVSSRAQDHASQRSSIERTALARGDTNRSSSGKREARRFLRGRSLIGCASTPAQGWCRDSMSFG